MCGQIIWPVAAGAAEGCSNSLDRGGNLSAVVVADDDDGDVVLSGLDGSVFVCSLHF